MNTEASPDDLDFDLLSTDEELGIKDFDVADYLDSPEAIAAYLKRMLDSGDDSLLAGALGDVARASGMAKIADASDHDKDSGNS